MVTVRRAGKSDIPAIDAMLARSYPRLLKADYAPSVLVLAIPLISRAQPRLITSGTYYVAQDEGGQILGAGGWTARGPTGEHATGTGHIRHFGTDISATRRGVARAIMDRCKKDATASGLERLNCYSTCTAEKFYAAAGFERIGPLEIELRPGIMFPAIEMMLELS